MKTIVMSAIKSLFFFSMMLCCISASPQEKIGLQLYTFRNQFAKDVPGTLQLIGNMGIKEIEGGGTYGLPETEFDQLLKKNGLNIISVGADFNELATNPQKAIDEAKKYGASYVVCFWIPHNGTDFTIDDTKKAVDVFNTAGKLIAANGLKLCYHAHGFEFRPYENGTLFDYMMKELNPQWANFEMDVFWIKHPGQDPVALLKKYPNRFLLMHLKDRKPGTQGNQNGDADVETNVVLGTGDVGIADIMKVAKKAGVQHYFIEDESSRSVEQVPQSLAYLKTLKQK
ncbi:MAG TPA: sugar phosphate isomerase/epimerase [Panacibacter sp.]|nr:sugar phosphate isomerase/epimerase [Panacibacter sp.]